MSTTDFEQQKADLLHRLERGSESLQRSEERFRLAQAVARIGTFEWDVQAGINVWTPELEAMYGLEPGRFAGSQPAWEALVFPVDRPVALNSVTRALHTGAPTEAEWRVVWPDGTVRWLAGRFQAFFDDAGLPLRLLGVNIDITERKLAEQEIVRLNDELEARVRDRTQALEATIHELQSARSEIRTLRGLLPMCAWCKRVRDNGEWTSVEEYVERHSDTEVSHGICPDCTDKTRRESQRFKR
jgi:PAS domain S-box-containing protein